MLCLSYDILLHIENGAYFQILIIYTDLIVYLYISHIYISRNYIRSYRCNLFKYYICLQPTSRSPSNPPHHISLSPPRPTLPTVVHAFFLANLDETVIGTSEFFCSPFTCNFFSYHVTSLSSICHHRRLLPG